MRRRHREVPRRLLVCALPVAAAVALVACDTDDGREMREPSSMQRLNLSQTSTTTSSTLAPVLTPAPTEPATTAAAPTTAAPSSAAPSSTAQAPASSPAAP
jgi:hypothetical protein